MKPNPEFEGSDMAAFVRWGLLLYLLYVLFQLIFGYVSRPATLFELDRIGFLRLAFLVAVAIACYLLGAAILKSRRRGGSGETPVLNFNEALTAVEHPIRRAFKTRPWTMLLLTAFPISLPFLFPLLPESSQSRGAYWSQVFIGELIVALLFVVVWYRAKYLMPKKPL